MNQKTICKSQNYLRSKELFADQRFIFLELKLSQT